MEKNNITIKMNNKRSLISGEVIMFIPRIIFLVAVLFAFVILVKILILTAFDIMEVEAKILVERMLFSRDGIVYYDESIERLYPGVIDLDKFKEISIQTDRSYTLEDTAKSILDNETIYYGSDNILIAANLTLFQEGEPDISVYYNKKGYDRWAPKVGFSGPGGGKKFKMTKNVLVKEGNPDSLYSGALSSGTLSFIMLS